MTNETTEKTSTWAQEIRGEERLATVFLRIESDEEHGIITLAEGHASQFVPQELANSLAATVGAAANTWIDEVLDPWARLRNVDPATFMETILERLVSALGVPGEHLQ